MTKSIESTQQGSASEKPPKTEFRLPPLSLLTSGDGKQGLLEEELQKTAEKLGEALNGFGITAKVVRWSEGPTVTLFEVELSPGVRLSRVKALADDIELALGTRGVRIFAPVPGTSHVGFEVPNATRRAVYLRDLLADAGPSPLKIAIGMDTEGRTVGADLTKMHHLLIAGTTGSGRVVEVNGAIMSILMQASPSEVRCIMIDTMGVQFRPFYRDIPHLYAPVLTDEREILSALSWAAQEAEGRLGMFSEYGTHDITSFNGRAKADANAGKTREGTELLKYSH